MANQAKAGKISRREFMHDMSLGRSLARPYGNRPPRRYFLIVCEGEETEPNYFNAIAAQLPKDMVNRNTVKGVGKNTLHLIDAAKEEIEKRRVAGLPDYYYVWLVFDRDEFPADHFNRTIDNTESINKQNMRLKTFTPSAIRRAERALDVQLSTKGKAWADMNPATRVHELVQSLMAYV